MTVSHWQPSAEELFLGTMNDLRQRSDLRANEYDMVQSAGLVRRLTMDQTPLMNVVNRKYRMAPKFVFAWNVTAMNFEGRPVMIAGPWLDPVLNDLRRSWQDRAQGLDPAAQTHTSNEQRKGLKDFLATWVARERTAPEGKTVTVREVITLYANKLGGVHFDTVDPGQFSAELMPSGEEFLRKTMAAIGRIVYRGLEPLAQTILLAREDHPLGMQRTVEIATTGAWKMGPEGFLVPDVDPKASTP